MPSSYPKQAKVLKARSTFRYRGFRAVHLYSSNKEKYFDPTIAGAKTCTKREPREQQEESTMIKIAIPQTASLRTVKPEPLILHKRTMSSQTQTLPSKHKRFDSLVSSAEVSPNVLSRDAQWSLVQQRLQHLDHGQSRDSQTHWLSIIDTAILLLALVKQESESKLFRYEVEHARLFPDPEVDNAFPNYDVGTHSASRSSSSPASSQAASTGTRSTHDRNTGCLPSRCHAPTSPPPALDIKTLSPLSPTFGHRRGSLLVGTVNRRRDTESVPLSPLSPTFGVRKGSLLAGTVNRRHSNPPPIPSSPVLSPFRFARQYSKSVSMLREERNWLQRDLEKRVQFGAAWIFIESHLDEYVRKFGFDGESGGRDEWRKEDIWMELVRLRDEESCVDSSAGRVAYIPG